MIFIYFIENKINGKIYVGKTTDPISRWKTHKSVSRQGKQKYPNKYFVVHAAMAKYGVDNFTFTVAEYYPDNISANEAEKYWIAYLKDFGILLYNATPGGDGMAPGTVFSESHRKNISLAKTGKKASLEARQNMSMARKLEFAGEKNNKAKIDIISVRELRSLYATGKYTHRGLAKMFNLTHATVGKIIRGELWVHIT